MSGRVLFDFSGRCLAVTGGAGLIGLACARLLAESGGHVHLVDPRAEVLEQAACSLAGAPGKVTVAAGALDSPPACRDALEAAGAPLAGLAHLAGVFEEDAYAPGGGSAWETAIEANLATAYRVGAVFQELRTPDPVSHLVFVSSMAAERGAPLHVAYATSKAGLHGLVRSLARRLAPETIVNGVSPGIVDSPMARALIERIGERGHRDGCLRRYARAEEIARVVVFLLSEGASYLTGQMIPVDGGASMK